MPLRISSTLGFRLLGLAVVLVTSILTAQPSHADLVVGCDPNSVTTYYSDASHSTAVGSCGGSCCGPCECTGTITAYRTTQRVYCPDVVCPQTS
ncbi:MAG: hypothetical protein QOF89_4023 [Acidobacteriota bacterium]|jgi:hypothetical protein|nr:hypothetical protein [Acidobacteriota bacterium]